MPLSVRCVGRLGQGSEQGMVRAVAADGHFHKPSASNWFQLSNGIILEEFIKLYEKFEVEWSMRQSMKLSLLATTRNVSCRIQEGIMLYKEAIALKLCSEVMGEDRESGPDILPDILPRLKVFLVSQVNSGTFYLLLYFQLPMT
ncbi:hypothetical protein E2C01_059687 [Portunus trituberculatus]|uniref:Uncharacterized protein n=1 Tax=Portunus trituberculatus TaxID=210409 RepID=A0A5B7H005_PORTR|nr:hypothetical protein [Portunus trituberculatus]